MADVMLDLETMGNGPRAAIVAIGAVVFDPDTAQLGQFFYRPVSLESSVRMGGEMDPATVLWWLQQPDAARALFALPCAQQLPVALQDFSSWLHSVAGDRPRIWGNGAAFDNVILAQAYRACGLDQPWRFSGDRCYRTVKAMHTNVPMAREGIHHHALDDAISQATHLMAMLRPDLASTTPTDPNPGRTAPTQP